MPAAHMYLFSDACPSDWLVDGQDEEWHTIVNVGFQLDPALGTAIAAGESHEEVLPRDKHYCNLIATIGQALPPKRLKKWSTSRGYKKRFCNAFSALRPGFNPIVSALSFQEKTLRASKQALLNAFN